MAVYYIDGTGGNDANDGLSEGAPKLNFGATVGVADGDVVRLRAGTTVALTANRYPAGNFTLEAYGDGPRPTLAIPGGTYQLSHTGSTPGAIYRATGIRYVQSGTIGVASAFAGGSSAATMIADNLYVEAGFQYGCRIGYGDGFRVRNCTILGAGVSGILVGVTGQDAPSNGVIERNIINIPDATDDGVTLHDGNADTGAGNVIRFNDITSGIENCIDVLLPYLGTQVYGNRCEAGVNATSTWSVIVMQGSGRVFGNVVIGGPAVAFLVHTSVNGPVEIDHNAVWCGASQQNGTLLQIAGAEVVAFHNNSAICPPDTERALLNLATFPVGSTIKANYIRHGGSAMNMYALGGGVTPAAASIDGNYYEAAAGTKWLTGVEFAAWQSTYSVDAASVASAEVPLITAAMEPLPGSPLLTDGLDLGYLRDIEGKQSKGHIGCYGAARLMGT